ncbi:MAG: hypothetical protein E6G42_07470 [Actinobacteria bacterium]|nr:MAG: hypothetical protein E6G42_07470 [Actinomycetota bacterium]
MLKLGSGPALRLPPGHPPAPKEPKSPAVPANRVRQRRGNRLAECHTASRERDEHGARQEIMILEPIEPNRVLTDASVVAQQAPDPADERFDRPVADELSLADRAGEEDAIADRSIYGVREAQHPTAVDAVQAALEPRQTKLDVRGLFEQSPRLLKRHETVHQPRRRRRPGRRARGGFEVVEGQPIRFYVSRQVGAEHRGDFPRILVCGGEPWALGKAEAKPVHSSGV